MDRPSRLTAALALGPMLAACATTISLEDLLRIEDRPADGVLRVYNSAPRPVTFWHNYSPHFGGTQMLLVRYRDRDGQIVRINGAWPSGHWWTPLELSSDSFPLGRVPRRSVTVPARGFLDFERNIDWYITWIRDDRLSVVGPCQIQFMLLAHPRRHSYPGLQFLTDWQPAECPTGR